MHCRSLCYNILAVMIFICLVVALGTCLISIISTAWWVGDFEAVGSIGNVTNIPNGYQLHLLFDVTFGLTRVCWGVHQDRLKNDPLPHPLINSTKKCITELPKDPLLRSYIEKDMAPFKHVFISLIIAVILIFLAHIFAFINLPCIRCYRKRIYLLIALILGIFAGIANLIGIIIANESFYYEANFMSTIMQRSPVKVTSKIGQMFLQLVLKRFQITDLSNKFHKGYSFDFACATQFFVFLSLILMVINFCCCPNQKSYDKKYKSEYKSELITDTYLVSEKDARNM